MEATTTFTVTGTFETKRNGTDWVVTDQWQTVAIESQDLDTEAEADELAAQFPKSYRLRVIGCSRPGGIVTWSVRLGADLVADGANGGVNEAGLARARKMVVRARKLGADVQFGEAYSMNTASADQVEALVG